jgi:4-amino-4-deoxy-L-arabinose transferase-like glycosyltransferase
VRARLRTHWLFLLLFACGAGLRVLVQVTYEPAIFFFDSFTYLQGALDPAPDSPRPVGYSILVLRPLLALHDLAAIPLVNHLCGLGMATLVYAVLLRRDVRPWLAALAAAPILLDGYLLQIEQNIASDTVFLTLVTTGLALLVWKPELSAGRATAAGIALGLAATVRFVGGPLLLVAVLYAVVTSRGRRRVLNGVLVAAVAAVPLLTYATWSFQQTGDFRPGGGSMSARTLYARTAPLADCRLLRQDDVPVYVQRMCPSKPSQLRAEHPKPYMMQTEPVRWHPAALPPGVDRYAALREFGLQVVANQPVDVAMAVWGDFEQGFAPRRFQPPDAWPLHMWQFHVGPRPAGMGVFDLAETIDTFGGEPVSVDNAQASVLRDYQTYVYTPGTLFAVAALLALLAALGVGGARRSGLRAPAVLVAGTGLVLLLSAAAYSFSWRYQLPSIPLLPWAGALALAALFPGLRRVAGPQGTDAAIARDESADAVASADFWDVRHRELAPVVVVIAAYDEARSIGDVIDELPRQALGLDVQVLVVDDGSTDGTGDVAASRGALVARSPVNRGQGAALRLGYRLAREGGARYVVTIDADGQYDPREVPVVLQPLLDGQADFVTGSRRLGRAHTTDPVRLLGVPVFAALISMLTGARITDPANGLRAMRVEVTSASELREPQYQASELLIAALAQGFRVVERPTTMRDRAAGGTKKGRNHAYALHFARVVLRTWLRERRRVKTGQTSVAHESDPSTVGS